MKLNKKEHDDVFGMQYSILKMHAEILASTLVIFQLMLFMHVPCNIFSCIYIYIEWKVSP